MTSPYAADDWPEEAGEERPAARILRLVVVALVLLAVPMLLIGAMLPQLEGCGGG